MRHGKAPQPLFLNGEVIVGCREVTKWLGAKDNYCFTKYIFSESSFCNGITDLYAFRKASLFVIKTEGTDWQTNQYNADQAFSCHTVVVRKHLESLMPKLTQQYRLRYFLRG